MAHGYSCEHSNCFVVHEDWECPLCGAEKEIKDLKDELENALEGGEK